MAKRLRIVFVAVTMFLVAVVFVSVFALMMQTVRANLYKENLQTLSWLNQESFRPQQPTFPDPLPPTCMILTLQVDGTIHVTAGHENIPDYQSLQQILKEAQETGEISGILEGHNVYFFRMDDPRNISYAFLDTTPAVSTLRNVLWSSIVIGVIALILFFPVCWLLARAITRPTEEALQQQRQFLMDASHELKTPLTVILTNAEMMQAPEFDQADRLRFAGTIQLVGQQMQELLESMLNLARIEHRSSYKEYTMVSLSDLAEECCMLFAPVYFESGRELDYSIEPKLQVWGDERKLQQIIDILLDNGNKYASPGSQVKLRLSHHGNSHCLLQVTSRGNVLSKQQCRDIFKRFYRADAARTGSGYSGSYGLGLPIAQQIAREHRGKIWCVGKDGQNIFYVQLPLSHN